MADRDVGGWSKPGRWPSAQWWIDAAARWQMLCASTGQAWREVEALEAIEAIVERKASPLGRVAWHVGWQQWRIFYRDRWE
jgi:hypothetical protein